LAGSVRIPLDQACEWAYPRQASGKVTGTGGSGGSIQCLGANGQVLGGFINGHSLDAWCKDPQHTGGKVMSGSWLDQADGEWVCIR
jgi:hypothetical protein